MKCIFDIEKFTAKPKVDIGAIVNRMKRDNVKSYSIDEIKDKLINGQTIRPSYCGAKEDSWISQQVFMIDIDNNGDTHRTVNDVIEHCTKIKILPNFIYTTFNHEEDHHKMRLVFVVDKEITDFNFAKQVQLYLMEAMGEVDEQCKNLNRFYYGGKEIVYDSGEILKVDELEKSVDNNISIEKKRPHNNNSISKNDNTYIIVGTSKNNDSNYIMKAIANRDVEYIRNKINHPHMAFNNNQEFCDYIFKEINLGELLEFKYPKSIRCIFHDDKNNSAGIFQNEKGYWIYNCFACGVSYNLLGVIEVLGKFKSRPKAYRFIREIFNLSMKETEWQKEQREILLENLKALNNGELEVNCPIAYKNIKSNIKYLNQLLLIAIDNISNEKMTDDDDNVLFFASTRYIAKQLGMSEHSIKEISKKNALFAYHKLLNKVDDTQANEKLVKRSKAIGANATDKNKKFRHVNYYSIPSYNNMLFDDIEEQGVNWKENGYTMRGLSREMFYRGEGAEVADWIYPQYKNIYDKDKKQVVKRTTKDLSDIRTLSITKIIVEYIDNQGYCLEKDIVRKLVEENIIKSKSESERQIKKSLKEILDGYNLKRIRANKEIKEKYNVDTKGYPFIIVKN